MLAAYDDGGAVPEGRPVGRPPSAPRAALSSERSSGTASVGGGVSESRQVLVPYWRQTDAARPVGSRRPVRAPQAPRADVAALRQKRQHLARIRKQICKRSRDLRSAILERRKLIESEIQLQVEVSSSVPKPCGFR